MATINRSKEIEAWQTARQLTMSIYELTKIGEFAQDFGLKDQIRRAAVSRGFMAYLETQPNARRLKEEGVEYEI